MNMVMEISAGISLANVAILIALLVIYVRIYRSSKAVFTLGLTFFSSALMVHNAIAVYAYFSMTHYIMNHYYHSS